tara:strand:- start:510 stop:1790 length:1281 start_codon:yes stop_codon:yes gene_type:complete
MTISIKNILAYLFVILTFISVNLWSIFPIGNTYTNWGLYVIILLVVIKGFKPYYKVVEKKNILYVKLFLGWVIVCFFRGLFVADFYWDYKNLLNVSLALLLPLGIFIFMNPIVLQNIFVKWIKFALPLFFFFVVFIELQSYGYYLVVISVLSLFIPALPKKWKFLIIGVPIFVILSSFDARSNVIKFSVPIFLSILYYQKSILKLMFLKIVYKSLFFLPLFFLILGTFSSFNIFKLDEFISGEYSTIQVVKGESKEVSLMTDTRTFIYEEVIQSALINNYVLFGRTPAQGYDSNAFGYFNAEVLGTGRYERYGSEVSIMNIFTWLGLVGVILYFLIFFRAVTLAISNSNNMYIKIVGLYVLFRWVYAWVEDFNRFDIMNVMLWIVVAMCYSPAFRRMTDKEFKFWVRGIFDKRYRKTLINRGMNEG